MQCEKSNKLFLYIYVVLDNDECFHIKSLTTRAGVCSISPWVIHIPWSSYHLTPLLWQMSNILLWQSLNHNSTIVYIYRARTWPHGGKWPVYQTLCLLACRRTGSHPLGHVEASAECIATFYTRGMHLANAVSGHYTREAKNRPFIINVTQNIGTSCQVLHCCIR